MLPEPVIAPTPWTSRSSFTMFTNSSLALSKSACVTSWPSFAEIVAVIWVELISGMNAVPIFVALYPAKTKSNNAPTSITALCLNALSNTYSYPSTSLLKNLCSTWSLLVNILDAMQGTKVRAINKLAISEYAIVRPISTNNCLVIPSVNTIGKNTHIVVRVEAHIAFETCLAP